MQRVRIIEQDAGFGSDDPDENSLETRLSFNVYMAINFPLWRRVIRHLTEPESESEWRDQWQL